MFTIFNTFLTAGKIPAVFLSKYYNDHTMKRIFITASILFTLQTYAQDNAALKRTFWQSNPNLASVKMALGNGFDFAKTQGAADPIFLAISNGASPEIINYLLAQPGVDIQHTLFEGRSYLHMAALQGNTAAAEALLAKGADINALDDHEHTPITYTAYQGKLTIPMVEVFMKHGLDLNKKYETKNGATVLLLAVAYDKDLAITDFLISKGASLKVTDNNNNTAFNYAATIGDLDIMKALLKRGIKYNDNALLMAAQGAFRTANKIEAYKYLVEDLKINPHVTDKAGHNVLHYIVKKQNQDDIIIYFFGKGVDINKADADGNTPFMGAAGSRNVETVTLMLPKLKNINEANKKGETALTNAVISSNAAVVTLLLKNGANVNVTDKEGHNLAYVLTSSYRGAGRRGGFGSAPGGNAPQQPRGEGAVQPGRAEGGERNGAPRVAPAEDYAEKLDALKKAGLHVETPFNDGTTLYHLAITKNDPALLKKISTLGIDVNAKDKDGITVLHKAAMLAKNDEILHFLLSIGANKELKTSFGESAYDIASENEVLKRDAISIDFLK